MKRYGNLWEEICSADNVRKAILDVCHTTLLKKHKRELQQKGRFVLRNSEIEALEITENLDDYVIRIQRNLEEETYEFGVMTSAVVYEPKKRLIDYPLKLVDRIYHHCLINVTAELLINKMTADTYGSLKGRGLTDLAKMIKRVLREHPDWYFLQTDFRHFFENIDHECAKADIRKVFKDKRVIRMYDKIIDHFSPGLAIGVFPSSYLANLYLNELDHLMKEEYRVKHYFRYMDDIVIVVPDKQRAKELLEVIGEFGKSKKLELKHNERIAPVSVGIRTCGYVFYPTHTELRKSIKIKMKKTVRKWRHADDATFKLKLASHFGWCKQGDCRHLFRKTLGDKYYIFKKNMEYRRLSDIKAADYWFGLPKTARVSIKDLFGKDIIVFEFKNVIVRGEDKIAVKYAPADDESDIHYFLTRSAVIADRLAKSSDDLPFIATISAEKNYYKID